MDKPEKSIIDTITDCIIIQMQEGISFKNACSPFGIYKQFETVELTENKVVFESSKTKLKFTIEKPE